MKLPNNCFYKGTLMHNRFVPKNHKFTYNIFYSFIDIDGLDDLKKNILFFLIINLIFLVFMIKITVSEITKRLKTGLKIY